MQIASSDIPYTYTLADAFAAMERDLLAKGFKRVVGSSTDSSLSDVKAVLQSQNAPESIILFSGVCMSVRENVYRGPERGGPGDR